MLRRSHLGRRSGAAFTASAVLAALLLAARSTIPKDQTLAFSGMVTNVGATVDPLMDKLTVAERDEARRSPAGDPNNFQVANAANFASIGDGSSTTKFRAGFAVVEGYSKLLVSLVDGSTSSAWQSQANSILQDVTSIAGIGLSTQTTALISQLLGQIATAASNAEARRLVLEGRDPMIALLTALRDAGDPMFRVLIFEDQPEVGSKTAAQRSADIEAARTQVSNYVVLLDNLIAAFGELNDAYLTKGSPESLADISAAAGALAADARAARTAYAALGR